MSYYAVFMASKWNGKSESLNKEKHSRLNQLQVYVFLEKRLCRYSWKIVGHMNFWALWVLNKIWPSKLIKWSPIPELFDKAVFWELFLFVFFFFCKKSKPKKLLNRSVKPVYSNKIVCYTYKMTWSHPNAMRKRGNRTPDKDIQSVLKNEIKLSREDQ